SSLAMKVSLLGLCAALVFCACSTYQSHLERGQRYYDESEFEQALALWRNLESDLDSLAVKDQAKYAYYRGMTDYRLDFRSHARHWLGRAQALDEMSPGSLLPEWKQRATEALEDLNKEVYSQGFRPHVPAAQS